MRRADQVAAIVVAALGITTIYLARQLRYDAEYGPGPGFLPFWLGVVLVVLSIFLYRGARRAGDADAEREDDGPDAPFFPIAKDARMPWLIFLLSTVAVAILFERLGLVLSTALFMLVTIRWVARRSWLYSAIVAVATPIVLYVGFVRLLAVPLPLGPFGS